MWSDKGNNSSHWIYVIVSLASACAHGVIAYGTPSSNGKQSSNLDKLNVRIKRKAVYKDTALWPNGVIPYVLTDDIGKNYLVTEAIDDAIHTIETDTCVQFKLLNKSQSGDYMQRKEKYVSFMKSKGCHSSVGRTKDTKQSISIGRNCGYVEMVLHELGHLLGLWHEHARPDRDNHIMVNWSNVQNNMIHNFRKQYQVRLIAPYDLSSVMHYGLKIFAANNDYNTIIPFVEDLSFLVGYRGDFSFYDKLTINTLYNCTGNCPPTSPSCKHDGFLDKTCMCVCPRLFSGQQCEHVITDRNCGGVFDVRNGTVNLSSPFYPNKYDNSMKCVWFFKSPKHTVMKLEFSDFDLEVGRGGVCRDLLEIRHHYIGLARGKTFCGNNMTRTFISTSNKLLLNFQSDALESKRGFDAKVSLLTRRDCTSYPCQNNGKCKQMEFYDDYYCECKKKWIGKHCEIPVVNGGVSDWSTWSTCIAGCGLQNRTRTCDNPKPQNGGHECTHVLTETRKCNSIETEYDCEGGFWCDFNDINMCDMEANGSSLLKWDLHKGPTPSMDTGPQRGHSSGRKDDPFVYMEASYGRSREETILWLPERKWGVGLYCLQFYYHIYGETSGSLRVLRQNYISNEPLILWQRSNCNGNRWHEANINILLYEGIKVGFSGIKGRGYSSDAALDDISLTPTKCSFPKHTYAKGCKIKTDVYPVGAMSYFEDCTRYNCFCNPDGFIDCPIWNREDICEGYDPYIKLKENPIKLQKFRTIGKVFKSTSLESGSGEAP